MPVETTEVDILAEELRDYGIRIVDIDEDILASHNKVHVKVGVDDDQFWVAFVVGTELVEPDGETTVGRLDKSQLERLHSRLVRSESELRDEIGCGEVKLRLETNDGLEREGVLWGATFPRNRGSYLQVAGAIMNIASVADRMLDEVPEN